MSKLKDIDNKAAEKGKGLETVWQFIKFIFVSLIAMIVQFTLLNTLKFIPPIHKMFDEAQSSALIVLAEKESKITNTEKLNGVRLGLPNGLTENLTGVDLFAFSEVLTFPDCAAAAEALAAGDVDCVIVDYQSAHDFTKEHKGYSQFQLESEQDFHWLFFFCAAGIGGLAYFIVNNAANIVAQIVSFFVNREKTFNSSANVAVTLPIYIVFTIALIAFSAWLNPTLKDMLVLHNVGDDLSANIATMICSAVQFFLYFPVDKILFHKKKEAAAEAEAKV